VTTVFIDLDRTLIVDNSAATWVGEEWRAGRLATTRALHAGLWLLCYRLGAVAMEDAIRLSAATMAGTAEQEMRERVERFYEKRVHARYRPGGIKAIEAHRQAGDEVVLLTSASMYLAELVVRTLGLDGALANQAEVDAIGCLTGRLREPLCFGEGKVEHARSHLARRGGALAESVAYSDSISDAPILRAVGRAIAVNPDARLRRLAARSGWKVVDWGSPVRSGPA
jgi:HAD superfamily hydrolase (TIGR01490 family)